MFLVRSHQAARLETGPLRVVSQVGLPSEVVSTTDQLLPLCYKHSYSALLEIQDIELIFSPAHGALLRLGDVRSAVFPLPEDAAQMPVRLAVLSGAWRPPIDIVFPDIPPVYRHIKSNSSKGQSTNYPEGMRIACYTRRTKVTSQ